MADTWTFSEAKTSAEKYSDGTEVPHRYQDVLLNGVRVGFVEIHMHKKHGDDGVPDASFGFTGVVYGPLPGGS